MSSCSLVTPCVLQHELSRAKSAEDISTEKEEDSHFDDLKGYASDSTISCSANRRHSVHVHKKKRRNSSRKKHASGTSDLVLKKEAGFFQSIGTKLLLSSSWNKMSSSRLIFKGSDNMISSGQGESNESLAPPDTKQRRKMAATRKQLKDPLPVSMEEENEYSFPINTRSGSWEKKRASDVSCTAKRRWSTEKMRDESRCNPPPTVRIADRCKEDRIPTLNVSSVKAWYDFPEDYCTHATRCPKKEIADKAKFEYLGVPDRYLSSDHYARKGTVDKDREHCIRGMSWNAARRGSIDDTGPATTAARTTRRRSVDVGVPCGVLHASDRVAVHSRRRKKSREESMFVKSSTQKEKMDDQYSPGRHKPLSGSLKKKKHASPSRHDKPGKRKHLHRSHSFSSVEDFMAGPSDNTLAWSNPRNHHPPLVQDSGNKWIVYGYV